LKRQFLAGLALLALATPAAAQRYFITVSGGLLVVPSAAPIAELNQFASQSFFASFIVDTRPAVFADTGPSAGQGASGFWSGAVSQGFVAIFAPGGAISYNQNANDPGNLFLINDGGVIGNTNQRSDQISISSSIASFDAGGPVRLYDGTNSTGFAGLPSDVFLSGVSFGRTERATLPALPGLLTDLSRPDFGALLQAPGTSPFLSLRFRRGTASNNTELLALPAQSLTSTNVGITVSALPGVPEPASWLLLVTGFGLTGAALRRRQVAAGAAVARPC
jgi:hypothetical protein